MKTEILSVNKINFGHKIFIDSGASKPEQGSLKITVTSDENPSNVIFSSKEINDDNFKIVCPKGFSSTQDYIGGICSRILETYDYVADRMGNLSEEDKKLTGIVLYVPGPVINNNVKSFANLKIKGTDDKISNVDFNEIDSYLKAKNINISDRFKLIATNDILGAGTGVAKFMANNSEYKDMFKEGFYGAIFMTGGGFGVCYIEHKGDNVEIKTSESGHNSSISPNMSLEKYGASAPALIHNYAKALNLDKEDLKKFMNLGNAMFTTDYPVRLKSEQADLLLKTGLFEVVENSGDKVGIALKGVTKQAHDVASKTAVETYIRSLAQLAASKVNEGVNSIILTGPLAKGINKYINDNPELFCNQNLEKLITDETKSFLDETGKTMANLYDFRIISDIDIKDNTVGGNLLLDGKFIGDKRGNWFSLPVNALYR